jgi:hypothetical protein
MGTPATSRELCSDRILDDAGGAFRMGAVGGSITYNNPPTPPCLVLIACCDYAAPQWLVSLNGRESCCITLSVPVHAHRPASTKSETQVGMSPLPFK